MTRLTAKRGLAMFGSFALIFVVLHMKGAITKPTLFRTVSHIPIDVVYTWVNGSDPDFTEKLKLEISKLSGNVVDKRDQRYYDNGIMRYSMRSIEVNAPWVRNFYVVTNGQVPCWLNTSNPRVNVVFHKDIFPYPSQLPTFSSPAIETHLHRIPGLSEEFLYFNDDIMLGAPVSFSDFYTPEKGYKTYFTARIPGLGRLDDKVFFEHSEDKADSDAIFFDSLRYSAYLLKHHLDMKMTDMVGHVPHLINRSIMERLQKGLTTFFNETSSHKFRHSNDIQVPSSYFSFLKAEGVPNEPAPTKSTFWHTLLYGDYVKYFSMTNNDWRRNKRKMYLLGRTKFYCFNDVINYSQNHSAMLAVNGIRRYLKKKYPKPSSLENSAETCS